MFWQILFIPFGLLFSITLFIFWFIFYILGFFVIPVGLLTVDEDKEKMNILFWLWDSYSGVNGTLDGNNENWIEICGSKENTRKFWNRYIWLAWRNPVSNLGTEIFGIKLLNRKAKIWYDTKIFQLTSLGFYWEYRFSPIIGMFRIGWKLQDRGQYIFRINPLKLNGQDRDWQEKPWF